MARYVTKRPAGWVEDDIDTESGPFMSMDVICESDRPIDTGLLDADGHKLFRLTDKEPIGFRLRR